VSETEFDPAAAEAPAHVKLEQRIAAIEQHLGIGEQAEAQQTETTEGEPAAAEPETHEGV
jgi:hypothetical protein